jgi:hypothetical protein
MTMLIEMESLVEVSWFAVVIVFRILPDWKLDLRVS